ncbi:MAG TPA: YihY/virulence factor BrkB family protein [Steroidobacteraceae bacterium]|nr:YihY/virulence factor BrkB family protein [Steroidobacteraceae bacterium]
MQLDIWGTLDRWLFGPASMGTDPVGVALRLARFPYALARDMASGEINLRAASLVFTTQLALVPGLAFSFLILKGLGPRHALEPIIFELVRPVGADAHQLTDQLLQVAERMRGGVIGVAGLVLLVWTLLGTLHQVEYCLNFLWAVREPRSIVRRLSDYLALLILGPALVVGFLALTHAALATEAGQLVAGLPVVRPLGHVGVQVAPYVMVASFFTVLYLLIPNTHVRFKPALIGAVCAGVVWAGVGSLFTRLYVSTSQLTVVYAGLAVLVALQLWLYFGWIILLAGARLSFYVQNPGELRRGFTIPQS